MEFSGKAHFVIRFIFTGSRDEDCNTWPFRTFTAFPEAGQYLLGYCAIAGNYRRTSLRRID
jgi:hypothetical protein